MLSRTKYKYNIVKDNQNHEHIYFHKLRTWNISLTTYYYSTHSTDFTRSPWPCDFADSHRLSRHWADSPQKIKFVCGGNAEKVKSAFCCLYSITHSFIKSINHIYYHQLRTANILNILKFIYTWTFCSLYIYIYYIKWGLRMFRDHFVRETTGKTSRGKSSVYCFDLIPQEI